MPPAIKCSRRWFRFSLRTMLVVVGISAAAAWFWHKRRAYTPLEGSWRGIGQQAALEVVFHRDELSIANRAGVRKSKFRIDPAAGTIEIYRDDGVQKGIYELAGNRMNLRLADVGMPAPAILHSTVRQRWSVIYAFERDGD